MTDCFHCGLPVPPESQFVVDILDAPRPMCCAGCGAVAEAIVAAGLASYYRNRAATALQGQAVLPKDLAELDVFNHPVVQKAFVRDKGTSREASLVLEGITCAACVWLNERHLSQLPGIERVDVNYATHLVRLRWNPEATKLSNILYEIRRIGYDAHPYDPGRQQQVLTEERRSLLKRLGVSAAFGMQIMILAVAMYFGESYGMEAGYEYYFRRLSLLLALPIVFYSAKPFFAAAVRDLKNRRTGMDVPVSLGIGLAFLASVWSTMTDSGEIYYDSVAMFVFLLLGARFLELSARRKAAVSADRLTRMAPVSAQREVPGTGRETIPATELNPGDRIVVAPGESIPADGTIVDGASGVNEALLTGEGQPVTRKPGDRVIGGSLNVESPLVIDVTQTGSDSVLSQIQRLLERAQIERPSSARLADRVAGWFVAAVLVLAAGVAAGWWWIDSERWLPVTISVLVVSCPCALSLATPAAIAAALGRLMQIGVIITRGDAFEALARTTLFMTDKTGTLTRGEVELKRVETLSEISRDECVDVAAALESFSEHPLAKAIVAASPSPERRAFNVVNQPGAGLTGRIGEKRYHIGSWQYVATRTRPAPYPIGDGELSEASIVFLADDQQLLCAFVLTDEPRLDASELVECLATNGRAVAMLTGDRHAHAARVADQIGIKEVYAELSPEEKLAQVSARQSDGEIVAMIGDGVNDAPVLGGANVSIAVANATPLAIAAADVVILSKKLHAVCETLEVARQTERTIKQNMGWAIGYNLLALPAAVSGLIPPWLAAIGMSLSSMIVVANALRLHRR